MLQLLENKIKIKVHSLKEKTYALFAIISVIRRKKVNTDVTVSYNEPSLSPILG
jgi:porphobilinogen deaminase